MSRIWKIITSGEGEDRRVKRYAVVRGCVVIWDITVYSTILSLYGMKAIAYAWAISSSLNYSADFLLQKFWTFGNPVRWTKELFKEFFLKYFPIRGGTVLCALLAAYVLIEFYDISELKAALIVVPVFFTIRFVLYRWHFFGTVRDLGAQIKTLAGKIFKRKN